MHYAQLLLLLLLNCLAFAQAPPTASQPDTIAAALPAAVPDTAAAIHRLFAARRNRQELVIGGTVLAVFTTVVVGAATEKPARPAQGGPGSLGSPFSPNDGTKGLAAVAAVILTLPLVLTEAALFDGWGRKKEQQIIKAWQQHRLPAFYKRKLKLKHFQANTK